MRGSWALVALVLLFCVATVDVASTQTLSPGVSKGDVFCYVMYGHYSSSDPDAVIYVPEFENNNTEWVRLEITGVSGPIVSHVYTLHFKNGTESRIDAQTDITKSAANSEFRGVPICATNLGAGDQLLTVQLTINETITRSYPSGDREINHVNWNSTLDYGDAYFDRKTGILIELCRAHLFINPNTGEIIKKTDIINMRSSNVWTISTPESPAYLIPTLTIISVTLVAMGAALYKRKTKLITKHS